MKVLIAYAGKTGSTREMAELLCACIPNHEVTLANLEQVQPDPAGYDYAVLGTAIRMNRAHKAMRRYLKHFAKALCTVPHSLFLCCAFPDQFDHYVGVAFPPELVRTAERTEYFGGDLSLHRHKGLEKWIVRMLRNAILEGEEDGLVLPGLLPEHVRLLGDYLRVR